MTSDQNWLEMTVQSSDRSSPSRWSSPSDPSSSSSEGSGSWTSGVLCLLHSSIRKQNQEALQNRSRADRALGELTARPSSGPHRRARPQAGQRGSCNYKNLHLGRSCAQTSNESAKLHLVREERIKAKLKFFQFLDEVTSNVLKPNCPQVLDKPGPPSSIIWSPDLSEELIHLVSSGLLFSMAQPQQSPLPELKPPGDGSSEKPPPKVYLETDIDSVRRDDGPQNLEEKTEPPLPLEINEDNVIPPPPQFYEGFKMKIPFPQLHHDFPRYPYRSASVPRGINMVSDESRPGLKSKQASEQPITRVEIVFIEFEVKQELIQSLNAWSEQLFVFL